MSKSDQVEIPAPKTDRILVPIVGDSPLIMNKWSEKAKKQMLDKQTGKANRGREHKDPEEQYQSSIYHYNGGYGFPSVAFKAAMVSAARLLDDIPMTFVRQALHVENEMVSIVGEPRMREDMVRVGRGTADIRFRAEFPEWEAELEITYFTGAMSAEQVVNLLNLAGLSVGVGDWRPEKNGSYGRFHVKAK